jgi:hypothetical protein
MAKIQRPRTIFGESESGGLGLFNPVDDRQQTMLAYKASYYPYYTLNDACQIRWHHILMLTKAQILSRCNEELTEIEWVDKLHDSRFERSKPFRIHWAYNNIPTQREWEQLLDSTVFVVDYRISPLIKDGGGRVCLFSFSTRE